MNARLQQLESLNQHAEAQSQSLSSIADLQSFQVERSVQDEQSRNSRLEQLAQARASLLTAINTLTAVGELDVEGPLADAAQAINRAAAQARSEGLELEALREQHAGALVLQAADAADRRDLYTAQQQAVAALQQLQLAAAAIRGGGSADELATQP